MTEAPLSEAPLMDRAEANRRFAGVFWRWVLVAVGAFCASAFLLSITQTDNKTLLSVATGGIALSTVLAFAADIMALISGCRTYLHGRSESLRPLTPAFWKAWASLTAISVAIWTVVAPPIAAPLRPDPWYVIYSAGHPPNGPRIATVPVLYANNADRHSWVKGVAFSPAEVDISMIGMQRIMAALRACASVPNAKPVELEIDGFASAKEFGEPKTPEERAASDALNVETANRRAWAAWCYARDAVGAKLMNPGNWESMPLSCPISTVAGLGSPQSGVVNIKVRHWSREEFDMMMSARQFIDRPPGISDKEKSAPEELDRRVDFNIVHAGGCERP